MRFNMVDTLPKSTIDYIYIYIGWHLNTTIKKSGLDHEDE